MSNKRLTERFPFLLPLRIKQRQYIYFKDLANDKNRYAKFTSDYLNEEVGEKAIRNYVAYSENISSNQNAYKNNAISPYTLGINDDALYVFYYQKDKITTLDMDFLASLKIGELTKRPSNFIIYADKCVLEKEFMLKHNITFKRIPRDIARF